MDMFSLRCYVHFCAACMLCRTSRGANTLTIEGAIPARQPAVSTKSSDLPSAKIQTPIASITITCCLPPSPSPAGVQHGYSLQRVTLMTPQDDAMPDLLADADPAVSDVASDVSGLNDVTVSGSVAEGCLVLVLRRGECQDSGEYMCASDYGTTTKVLDMYPGEVAIEAESDGPLKHPRQVQCRVFSTVEITWSWQSRHYADSPWIDITTGNDHNVSDVIPDVIDRCDVAWTSVLRMSRRTSDRRWSFRCCAGYRDVSNVSCATWSPVEPERTSSSSTITTMHMTHSDVNFSLTSSTMTTATNNVSATVDHGMREAVRAQPVKPLSGRKSSRPATELGAVVAVVVVAAVVTVVTMVVFAVHRAVSGRRYRSNSTPRGRHVMTTTLSQRPLTRHNTIIPVDT